ncbi:MAG TPA: ATP-grasp fold amidoligase family protein [Thiobacillus sp.]|nr:MAG: hypothetical protein B7Y27_07180 [Hydrogenophilales bacterium 16-64-40]OZA35002.1 MAG: hypothetical protein B7X82_03275 [Hydrogenophilales bacterium 17-64-65]HQS80882.1 ATP-grasp fold amidoligase family protein [Thiobacillus sp.]HQT33502.1 ATP-grasp fold amidoligase family protein [Thiobacillus sp.]
MSISEKINALKKAINRKARGEKHFKNIYLKTHGKELNTREPKSFSEKLFCRMIEINSAGNKTYSKLADKYKVREHISKTIGEKYLVKLLWHGANPDKIPFESLPQEYIIKANHGSGMVIPVRGDVSINEIQETISSWLKTNYYLTDHEYHYAAIKPLIIIEEYLDDKKELGPLNYSFWCINGQTAMIQVDNSNRSINPFYDTSWNKLPLTSRRNLPDSQIEKPKNLDEMLSVAHTLAKDFDFVRVDLYNINGKVYFGELTFTPGSGRFKFLPEEWDIELGRRWHS